MAAAAAKLEGGLAPREKICNNIVCRAARRLDTSEREEVFMKMKSAVLASALVAVSSVFADIYTNGDIYNSWFTAGSDTPTSIDTTLDNPTIVNGNTVATASNGYAVTAEVSVVIHATRPDEPTALGGVNPKGSICAAYDGGVESGMGCRRTMTLITGSNLQALLRLQRVYIRSWRSSMIRRAAIVSVIRLFLTIPRRPLAGIHLATRMRFRRLVLLELVLTPR